MALTITVATAVISGSLLSLDLTCLYIVNNNSGSENGDDDNDSKTIEYPCNSVEFSQL